MRNAANLHAPPPVRCRHRFAAQSACDRNATHVRGLALQDAASFMKEGFERGPAVFKATPARRALFSGLVDYAALLRLAQKLDAENDPLLFEKDINAARYVNGKRETLNGKEVRSPADEDGRLRCNAKPTVACRAGRRGAAHY
jgi:hypothetical protein